MELSEKEKDLIESWRKNAEFRAADLGNEWLKGLYTGEAMAYKVILRVCGMEKEKE